MTSGVSLSALRLSFLRLRADKVSSAVADTQAGTARIVEA